MISVSSILFTLKKGFTNIVNQLLSNSYNLGTTNFKKFALAAPERYCFPSQISYLHVKSVKRENYICMLMTQKYVALIRR